MKKFRTFFLLTHVFLLLSLSRSLQAEAHHKGILSSVNLGARVSNLIHYRGVIFYNQVQIDPILAIFLVDDHLEYLGDSLGYRDFVVPEILRLRTRFQVISDAPLFPVNDALVQQNPNRKDTFEWNNSLEFFLPGYNSNYRAELDLIWAHDMQVHFGDYLEILLKVKLFDFTWWTLIEPNIFASLGWGNKRHNSYFYGPDDEQTGINNFSVGLWFAFPNEADRFYPIFQIRHFETLWGHRNKEYSRGRGDGWLVSFIATFDFLDAIKYKRK